MAEKRPSSREQIKQIVAGIEDGIQRIFQSENYMDYLRTMSRFHTYSYKNTMPITIKPLRPDVDGLCNYADQVISIQAGMSQVQTVCATVHEITHAMLHDREHTRLTAAVGDETKEPPKPKGERTKEVEAESVSYSHPPRKGAVSAQILWGWDVSHAGLDGHGAVPEKRSDSHSYGCGYRTVS